MVLLWVGKVVEELMVTVEEVLRTGDIAKSDKIGAIGGEVVDEGGTVVVVVVIMVTITSL